MGMNKHEQNLSGAWDMDELTKHRQELVRCVYRIWHDEKIRLPREEAKKLCRFANSYSSATAAADIFGLNRWVLAAEVVEIAAHAIQLRGSILKSAFLWMICPAEVANEVEATFGSEIASGFRALHSTSIDEVKEETLKSDLFQNLLVAKSADMRALLVVIARSVALMRRIKNSQAAEARRRLSVESAYVYAPLAHKLGLYQLKSELEDLSLKYLETEAYYHIKEELNATKRSRDEYILRFTRPIREMLEEERIIYSMKGRTKSIHSIWQKMKKQQCSFSGVYDLFAIRIIIDAPAEREKELCWKTFSLITAKYESNLKRLRDWITVPKNNGYESLHITVKGPEEKWVEVQIRTRRMDDVAEHGLAAHWRYKGVSSGGVDTWLSNIRTALEQGDDASLSQNLSDAGGPKEVYVFSPKGDLYRLPQNATVLDFAYHIHTAVGNRCVGARINGKNVPIRHQLESGSTVEILTSNTQTPKAEWEQIVVSSHAKSKIRTAVKDLRWSEATMGRELLERKFKNRKIEWDEGVVNQLIKKMGFKESFEFYKQLAEERISWNEALDLYEQLYKREAGLADRATTRSAEEFNFGKTSEHLEARGESDVLIIDRNIKGLDFQLAHCCNPVYGDEVFGFVTVGGGIKVHRTNCPNAPALQARFPYRVVPAKWSGKGSGKYPITLHVVGQDDLGIVNNITSIISKSEHVMLRSINIDANDGLFSGILTVMVDDTQVLTQLIKKISTVKGVKAVSRT